MRKVTGYDFRGPRFRAELLRFLAAKDASIPFIIWVDCLPENVTPEELWAECDDGEMLSFLAHHMVTDARHRFRAGLAVALLAQPVWPQEAELQKMAQKAVAAIETVVNSPDAPAYATPEWTPWRDKLRADIDGARDATTKASHAFSKLDNPAINSAAHALLIAGYFGGFGQGLGAVAQQAATALAHAAVAASSTRAAVPGARERSQAWSDAYDAGLAQCADAIRTVITAADVWPLPVNDGEENAPAC